MKIKADERIGASKLNRLLNRRLNPMNAFPLQLDGAHVLWFAEAISGQNGHDYETGQPLPISKYAVAQYPGDEPRVYLFAISSDHNVVGDSVWGSPEEALRASIDSGFVRDGGWKQIPNPDAGDGRIKHGN